MKRFENWDEVVKCVSSARNKGCMVTNFFPDEKRMKRWCEKGDFSFEESSKSTFLIRHQETFSNLYFLTESSESLIKDISSFLTENNSIRIVVDVLGPDIVRKPLETVFESLGFKVLTVLQRMSRRTPSDKYNLENGIETAKISDTVAIHSLLTENFIAEEEQIPCLEEIQNWINSGSILVSRANNLSDINGFIIFDFSPATLYLRYWFVLPDGRGNGLGGRLMRSMFAKGEQTKRQYFWVKTNNVNAIIRYKHYGFEFEPLKDAVFMLESYFV